MSSDATTMGKHFGLTFPAIKTVVMQECQVIIQDTAFMRRGRESDSCVEVLVCLYVPA